MADLQIHQFAYMSDNYGVLIHDPETGQTAMIDAGDADAGMEALAQTGWTLSHIFVTHHHGDHVAGLAQIKGATGAMVIGPNPVGAKIAGLDQTVGDNDRFRFAGREVVVFHTPGHTMDMVNFHIPADKVVFCGDTLFALGCGRVFEGTMGMMWDSLQKLMALPAETRVYCGHEYTQANAAFSLSVDPDNEALIARAQDISALRAAGTPTIPTSIREELATNPFLRPADPAIRAHLGMEDAADAEVFSEIRTRKDNF